MAAQESGHLGTHTKTLSGLREYRSRWDDEILISSLEPPSRLARASEPGTVWEHEVEHQNINFIAQLNADTIRKLGPCIVQVAVNAPKANTLIGQGFPVVLTDDNSPKVRTQVALLNSESAIDRTRIRLGDVRQTRRFDRLAQSGQGFQCNGFASYAPYRKLNPNTHLFFDHRISGEDVQIAQEQVVWDGRRPLHVAFSGRLLRIKGVDFIPQLVKELECRDITIVFTVLGAGPLLSQLQSTGLSNLVFRGYLDFETEWKSFVRSDVDLMFLPHLQGDSSSTYFEAMGSGSPILGFRNETLTPLLAAGGGGWEVKKGDVAGACDVIEAIIQDPTLLAEQRTRGLDFMSKIPSEKVFDRRMEHFRQAVSHYVQQPHPA